MSNIDLPDYSIPALGPISKESRVEWRSILSNDNGIVDGQTPPIGASGIARYGKFFPRGCRGKIERLEIYCRRTAAGTLDLSFSPEPGMGAVDTVTVTPSATWTWQSVVWRHFWNYDSLFIWINRIDVDVLVGLDAVQPYDNHLGDAPLEHWQRQNYRLFIRVVYDSETPGDIPVSGTLNVVDLPSLAAYVDSGLVNVPVNTESVIATIIGSGKMINCFFVPSLNDVNYRLYADGVLIWDMTPATMNAAGFMASTPKLSLLTYNAIGYNFIWDTRRIPFRRILQIRAYNGELVPVTVYCYLDAERIS